ncbi:MAG: hypothetical protein IGR80_10905 [Synechococcales cyanobacterium K44_A2020_017]|nr:hypothetical protein [Synechococcales cyanobacterium K32_A2020_035]MBF2095252.1 hypothetical protein [Synechococcales cyanobacterium K44_A2020_017]
MILIAYHPDCDRVAPRGCGIQSAPPTIWVAASSANPALTQRSDRRELYA